MKIFLFLSLLILFFSFSIEAEPAPEITSWTPVIGVFCQPSEDLRRFYDPNQGFSYISASYVKWIESQGGRVVPIPYNLKTVEELDHILDNVNGILMPGGDASLWEDEQKKEKFSHQTWVGQRIYEKAKQYNDNGDVFPIWATCMSYEMILLIVTQNPKICDNYDSHNHSLNTTILNQDGLFKDIPADIKDHMEKNMAMFYSHSYGIDVSHFNNEPKLTADYILTSSSTYNGKTFVGTLEGKKYPFILSQYHPEKNQFEFLADETNANHDALSIKAAEWHGNYFMNFARQSKHKYSWDEFKQESIQNYFMLNSMSWKEAYVQVYTFRAALNTDIPASYIKTTVNDKGNQKFVTNKIKKLKHLH